MFDGVTRGVEAPAYARGDDLPRTRQLVELPSGRAVAGLREGEPGREGVGEGAEPVGAKRTGGRDFEFPHAIDQPALRKKSMAFYCSAIEGFSDERAHAPWVYGLGAVRRRGERNGGGDGGLGEET